MQLRTGMPVRSSDGPWGELDDLIVDPTTWHLTHLVVQPHHRHNRSRLVPLSSVGPAGDALELTLSAEQIETAPLVAATDIVKVDAPNGRHGRSPDATAPAWPTYPYTGVTTGLAGVGFISGFSSTHGAPRSRYAASRFDRIPAREIELRRTTRVLSRDGHRVGHVGGLIVDPSGAVTDLVLEHGHLWGLRKVAIPAPYIRRADSERVRLDLDRDDIEEFATDPVRHLAQVDD